MSTPVEAAWSAYQQAVGSLAVTRRVLSSHDTSSSTQNFIRGTVFDGLATDDIDPTIDALQDHLDDQAVLSIYAGFESTIRDHLIAQAVHLRNLVNNPDANFAESLAANHETWCEEIRMNEVAAMFKVAVGATLVSQVGQIRAYRNWLAHGKRRPKPPQTTPLFAYQTLTQFLGVLK